MTTRVMRERWYLLLVILSGAGALGVVLRRALHGQITVGSRRDLTALAVLLATATTAAILLWATKCRSRASANAQRRLDFLELGLGSSLLFVLGSLVGAAACAYWSGMLSTRHGDWSIGIYSSDNSHPLAFSGKGIRNPAITAADVADFPAQFVADPFLMWNDGRYLLFFEGWNRETDQGDICLSSSGDGLTWHYDRVVLDEPYSLSYPQVFLWKGNWYLIPCIPSGAVQLYKANKFPYEWQYVQTVLQGERFQDVSVLEYGDSLWLFAGAGNRDELRLYSSETPLGPWQEHPRSPIIEGDPNHARPGGKPLQVADRIFRFAQDCSPYYGNQVWAFEVTELTPTSYAERLYRDLPVLMGFEDWNVRGMHTLSAIPGRNGGWIAAVDGHGRFGDKKDFED